MSESQTKDQKRLNAALAAFDLVNGSDPNIDEGEPKELLYSKRMSSALADFAPDASEALRLAARAQHIKRWASQRGAYPMGRAGYLKWRSELKRMHAEVASGVLAELGYEEPMRARVSDLIQKRGIKTDPEVQCLEDVVCLVFLRFYWKPFAAKHDDEKLIEIVRKTWAKMSDPGHQAALALDFDVRSKSILDRALAG